MRGRKPKPLALGMAEGDTRKFGKHKLEEKLNSVPRPSHGLPECPRYLQGRARTAWNFWRSELEAMELDAATDGPLLKRLA
jgi:phage terminase small subunit